MPLAYIHFLDDARPTPPIVIPPEIWGPGDARPSVPIVIPQPPLGIWGPTDPRPGTGPVPPQPGIEPPKFPTNPIVIIPPGSIDPPKFPTNPIVIPLPPEIWGPTDPRPDQGLPGDQPKPVHPIVIPEPPEVSEGDKALVLVVHDGQAVWFVIDGNEDVQPPPTQPQPKRGRK